MTPVLGVFPIAAKLLAIRAKAEVNAWVTGRSASNKREEDAKRSGSRMVFLATPHSYKVHCPPRPIAKCALVMK
jgi:hypothetical protein